MGERLRYQRFQNGVGIAFVTAMLENDKLPLQSSDDEYSPKRYSLRSSAVTIIKLLLVGGGVLGALWALDTLVAP